MPVKQERARLSVKEARLLFGHHRFFGIEDWEMEFGNRISKKEKAAAADFPWTREALNSPCPFIKGKKVKETHFAFMGLQSAGERAFTIVGLHRLFPFRGQPRFHFEPIPPYMRDERFSVTETCRLGWYLMLLDGVPRSEGKPYEKQCSLLPPEYEVPKAVEEVMKRLLFFKKTRIYAGGTKRVRCRDLISGGDRAVVGPFSEEGLAIEGMFEDATHDFLGIAASRLPDR